MLKNNKIKRTIKNPPSLKLRRARKKEFIFPLYFGWEIAVRRVNDLRKHIVGPFRKYWQYMTVVVLLIALVSGGLFLKNYEFSKAATYYFIQSDWSGGTDGGANADHTNNKTNWNQYSAEDNNIATSTDLSLSAVPFSWTQTTDADFNLGATSTAVVSSDSVSLDTYLGWAISSPDTAGSVGQNTSIAAIDANNIFISYYDSTNSDLKFAKSTDAGVTWTLSSPDTAGDVGSHTSIAAIDASNIFISYQDVTNLDLKFAKSADAGVTWTLSSLDTAGSVGKDTSIAAIDANNIFISYNDDTNHDLKFAKNGAFYYSSGTYTSTIYNTTKNPDYSTISWSTTTPASTNIEIRVRSCDDAVCSGETAIAACDIISNGQDISSSSCVNNGDQYIQYYAALSTTDNTITPSLDDITINYQEYPSSQNLTSSRYNTESAENVLAGVKWDEDATLPTGTGVAMSVRTGSSAATLNVASWAEVASTTAAGYITSGCTKDGQTITCTAAVIPAAMKDGAGDQWIQYKIALTSTGYNAPTIDNINLIYVVNAAPEFNNDYPTAGDGGVSASSTLANLVNINYSVRDPDTDEGSSGNQYKITPSFAYSTDNGSNWTDITTGLSANATTTKTVAKVEWNIYAPTWDAASMIASGVYSTTAKIKVTADDNELANNTAIASSSVFVIDTKAPTLPSIVIKNNDAYASSTSVVLTISASDDDMTDMQMMIGNDAVFTDGVWENYSTSKDWTLSSGDGSKTVYIKFKDQYSNESASANDSITLDTTPPNVPANMTISDISNYGTNEFRLFVAWGVVTDPGDWNKYNIWRSTDGSDYGSAPRLTELDRNVNYFTETELDTNLTYYYKITTQDSKNNVSAFSSIVSDQPDGQGGTDTTPPIISNVATSSVFTTQATIVWDTNELANSTVGHSATAGVFTTETGVASMLDNAAGVGQHSIVVTGLTSETTYYFQVKSQDASTNETIDNNGGDGYVFTTLPGPAISNVSASDISNTSAVITWNTDINSDSTVTYSPNSDLSSPTIITGTPSSVTEHSVTVSGLSIGTKYYYKVESGVATDNNGGNYYTFTTTQDSTAPTIIFVLANDVTNITDTSATISWVTDELATSTLEYGEDTNYASSTLSNNNYNTNHSYDLSGLTLGTTYYFRIKSTDANSNIGTSDNSGAGWTFTTTDSTDVTAPNITVNPFASPIGDTYAVINWTTNESSNSTVDYGTTAGTYTIASTSSSLNISHAISLSGLTADTAYYYQITSTDANSNSTSSAEYTFTTLETQYGGTEFECPACPTCGGGGGGCPSTDKTAPTISNIVVSGITSANATVEWKTNEKADSFAEYGMTDEYGNINGRYEMLTEHSVLLDYLSPSSEYSYRIATRDFSGNIAYSSNKTFTTLSLTEALDNGLTQESVDAESLLTMASDAIGRSMDIIKRVASYVSISPLESSLTAQQTSIDALAEFINAPLMSGEPKVITTAKTAAIAWRTDKEANSLVAIAPESQYNASAENPYQQVVGNPTAKTMEHAVTIHSLEPDTLYHFQLRNKASVGPMAQSRDFTFRTEKEILEISNYTIQNISNEEAVFKWVTNVEADSVIKYIPYRNNILAVDEVRTKSDQAITIIHEIAISDFEAGVIYEVELISQDISNNTANEKISAFSTAKDDMPPIIQQVQTASALSPGKDTKVQTIISWKTNEPSTTRVYYQKGIANSDQELSEITKLDTNYTKKHIVVITEFDSGAAYSFRAESIDSGGNVSLSKVHAILTPRQKESVFQVIMKNMEEIFGWVGKMKK